MTSAQGNCSAQWQNNLIRVSKFTLLEDTIPININSIESEKVQGKKAEQKTKNKEVIGLKI